MVFPGRGKAPRRLEDDLGAGDAIGRRDRQPPEGAHGDVGAFLEAELVRIEIEGAILIVDENTDEFDLHDCLRGLARTALLPRRNHGARLPRPSSRISAVWFVPPYPKSRW
jgi:hypothetical protein